MNQATPHALGSVAPRSWQIFSSAQPGRPELADLIRLGRVERLTGRFLCASADGVGELYLQEGALIHCYVVGLPAGTESLVALLSWQTGKVCFEAGRYSRVRTLPTALLEGESTPDQTAAA